MSQPNETTSTHANNVLHFAVQADDLDRAREFYEQVFAWRFEEWGPPDFYRVHTGTPADPGIAGALEKRNVPLSANHASSGFTCTISVSDIAVTRQSIEAHGGKVTFSGEIPTVGKILSFADPEDNIVCAMQYEAQALEHIRQGI